MEKIIAHELRVVAYGMFYFIRAISFSLLSCNPNKLLEAAVNHFVSDVSFFVSQR